MSRKMEGARKKKRKDRVHAPVERGNDKTRKRKTRQDKKMLCSIIEDDDDDDEKEEKEELGTCSCVR